MVDRYPRTDSVSVSMIHPKNAQDGFQTSPYLDQPMASHLRVAIYLSILRYSTVDFMSKKNGPVERSFPGSELPIHGRFNHAMNKRNSLTHPLLGRKGCVALAPYWKSLRCIIVLGYFNWDAFILLRVRSFARISSRLILCFSIFLFLLPFLLFSDETRSRRWEKPFIHDCFRLKSATTGDGGYFPGRSPGVYLSRGKRGGGFLNCSLME